MTPTQGFHILQTCQTSKQMTPTQGFHCDRVSFPASHSTQLQPRSHTLLQVRNSLKIIIWDLIIICSLCALSPLCSSSAGRSPSSSPPCWPGSTSPWSPSPFCCWSTRPAGCRRSRCGLRRGPTQHHQPRHHLLRERISNTWNQNEKGRIAKMFWKIARKLGLELTGRGSRPHPYI